MQKSVKVFVQLHALLLIERYLPMKFQVDISYSLEQNTSMKNNKGQWLLSYGKDSYGSCTLYFSTSRYDLPMKF